MLDESEDSARHELRAANGGAAPCYLCDRDHPSPGRDLDAPAGTRRLDVVSAYVTAGVDDNFYAVALHEVNNARATANSP